MSLWHQYDIYQKLRAILATVSYPHHFGGRPFITAYQLAIAFSTNHESEFRAMKMPIGGEGTGRQNSLSQYLSVQLSKEIHDGSITDIEGAFLDNLHLNTIKFNAPGGPITSSLTGSGYPLSMFRLKDE